MNAIVVFESLWGNTAEVARAVAEGLGRSARALRTDEVGAADVESADLIVAGAPVFGFKLSSEKMREGIRRDPGKGPAPDLSCPSLRSWLEKLPPGTAWVAAFDTQVRGPFGKGAPEIVKLLEARGYRAIADPVGFIVKGSQGPLRKGEAERARAWGEQLARLPRVRTSLTPRVLPLACGHRDPAHLMQPSASVPCTRGGGGMT